MRRSKCVSDCVVTTTIWVSMGFVARLESKSPRNSCFWPTPPNSGTGMPGTTRSNQNSQDQPRAAVRTKRISEVRSRKHVNPTDNTSNNPSSKQQYGEHSMPTKPKPARVASPQLTITRNNSVCFGSSHFELGAE